MVVRIVLKKLGRWLKVPYRTERLGHYHEEDGRIIELGLRYTRWDDLKRVLIWIAVIVGGAGSIVALFVWLNR